jgi:hypothetical protein
MKIDRIKNEFLASDIVRIQRKGKVDDIFREIDPNNKNQFTDSKT